MRAVSAQSSSPLPAPSATATPAHTLARLFPRLAAAGYECVLLFGVYFISAYLYLAVTRTTFPIPPERAAFFSAYIACVMGLYFVFFWVKSGQTLAMKTWEVRLLAADGARISIARAIARYLLGWGLIVTLAALITKGLMLASSPGAAAVVALTYPLVVALLLIACVAYAMFDRDQQFAHDRLLGTRLFYAPGKVKKPGKT
ncbi:MAG: hypothetical protein RL341_789 [Pseudomonadota bacterium]|jgi:uncharacterized RDD family membrane protein YckC